MAQHVPEVRLLSDLRDKFPEVTPITIMKFMKTFNNDTDKCIQALEQESQRSMFGAGSSSQSQSSDQNSNAANHSSSASSQVHMNSGNRNSNSSVGSTGTMSASPSRYQELPVKHEQSSAGGGHHVSTVQHTITAAAIPRTDGVFARPAVPPPVQTRTDYRPTLVIDPANRGHFHPNTAPVKSPDFSPFLQTPARTRAEIPNIRCDPSAAKNEAGAARGGASGESPTEQRRPVRVINVQGQFFTGGTVTSRSNASPTSASQGPQFFVRLGDGGGVCVSPVAMASQNNPSPAASSANFSSHSYASSSQETDRSGIHSSSIFIGNAVNSRRTNVQETGGDQTSAAQPSMYGTGGVPKIDSQGPTSLPVNRTVAPLSVSLSSHVAGVGPEGRVHSVVAYNPGRSNVGGVRYSQETVPPTPPRTYPASSVNVMMNSLNLSPNQTSSSGLVWRQAETGGSSTLVYPGYQASSPGASNLAQSMGYTPSSPHVMHRSPSLQHQRSTGSSTSRSNSIDSEHGSIHMAGGSDYDPQHTPPLPRQASPLPHQASPHVHRVGVSVMPVAVPVLSPSSSQSSLSSESSTRERENPNVQRPRSGSMQEEAAYTQALLEHQRQRMQKLTEDIQQKRHFLEQLRQEVSEIEKSEFVKNINTARTSFPTPEDIAKLCESNRRLQTDIQMYLNELDMYRNGQTPFSVIDPLEQQNFYKNMPTGPNDLTYTKPADRPRSPPPTPPPRPPPPRPPLRINSNDITQPVPAPPRDQITQGGGSGDSEEGESWPCSACTFRNHPALNKCEVCEMPRINPGREGLGLGMVGSVSMPHLHQIGGIHRGAEGQVCYCHNRHCQQKASKL